MISWQSFHYYEEHFELTNLNIVFSHRQSPLPYIAVK